MDNLFISQFSLEQFKAEISEDVFKRVAPFFQSLNPTKKETELLTRKQAAEFLGVSTATILLWSKEGKISGYRISSRVRYKRSELEDSLKKIKGGSL